MDAQDKQCASDRVELKGFLSEFRDALKEEIDKIKKSGKSLYAPRIPRRRK